MLNILPMMVRRARGSIYSPSSHLLVSGHRDYWSSTNTTYFSYTGSGTTTTLDSSGNSTVQEFSSTVEALGSITPTASSSSGYQFTIEGDFTTFSLYPSSFTSTASWKYVSTIDQCVLDGVTTCASMFRGMSILASCCDLAIPEGVTDANNMFRFAKVMAAAPMVTFPSTIEDISYFFSTCTAMASLPSGFAIPANAVNLTYMFYNCKGAFAIPTFPDAFTNPNISSTNKLKLQHMFEYDNAMTGTAPADKLWNNSFFATGTSSLFDACFSQCSALSNYAQIPTTWGGTAA